MAEPSMVLVPLDDAWIATAILPYAELLARTLGAEVRLLSVTRERSDSSFLEGLAVELRSRGVPVSTAVEHGDPVERILAAANREGVELVVMATHGRGGLERLLIGSVADAVMRACSRPTLLVVPSDFEAAQPVELKRLLLPLDGSTLAEAALPVAARLAGASGAVLTLVQVVEPVTASVAPVGYVPNLAEWERERANAALAYLGGVRSRLPATLASEALVLRAIDAAAALAGYVQSAGIDLLIMSSRGLGGFRRLVVGSTADRLIRSAVPTLLVHPAEPAEPAEGQGQEAGE